MRPTIVCLLSAAIAASALIVPGGGAANAAGNALIANAASASYEIAAGRLFTVTSNTVEITVAAVGALAVSPKEDAPNAATETFGGGLPIVRTFTITNAGNVPDAYVLTAVTTGAGTVSSVAFVAADGTATAAAVGAASSPAVAPGASIGVRVGVATTAVAPGTTFAIAIAVRSTAGGTANGAQTDGGQRWAIAVAPPAFTGPLGARTAIVKTVDETAGEQSQPGSAIVYQIRFRNDGAVPATGTAMTDEVPAGIRADPAAVLLDGNPVAATLSGRTLRVALGSIAPGTSHQLSIGATVEAGAVPGASYVNTASLQADGVATALTTPAGVFIGFGNIVFDAVLGAGHPVASAVVTLVDPASLRPLPLGLSSSAARRSSSVNAANANPFTTGPDGVYAFRIPAPAPGTTTSFQILLHAPGYAERAIATTLVPDATGTLYTVTLTALDGQPLAMAGGFALTGHSVALADVFGLLGNLPMLSAKPIVVVKSADRAAAESGDRVSYTIAFTSTAPALLGAASIVDTPPAGLAYARGTARLDGAPAEPLATAQTLTWELPALEPGHAHTLVYASVVLPGVSDGATLVNRVTVRASVPGTAFLASTGSAQAGILVHAGVFSDTSLITGRVFADVRRTAHFTEGDRGIAGVRIFMENGASVTTDADGRFSFHGVRPGMHVLRLDETTLPRGVRLAALRGIDDARSPVRLLHGIFDEGLMHDVQFAVEAVG